MSLRSIVTINASGQGLDQALSSEADATLLTVATDARPVAELRAAAREAIAAAAAAGKAAFVLVNHPRTQLLRADLDALTMPGLTGVFVNHTREPQDLRDTAVLLREFELNRDIEPGAVAVYAVIRTASALLRAADLMRATNRVAGAVFDSDAYARDIGARAEECGPRLAYARGLVVAAARANDALPLVTASPLQALELSQYGFAGIVLPDADGAPQANAAFTPYPAVLDRARRHVAAYDEAHAHGDWVARDGADIVDASSVRKARQLLD